MEQRHEQIQFGGGLNAQASPHLLAEGEVQLATNVDFSLELGALLCRRGCQLISSGLAAQPVLWIGRNYNGISGSLDTSPWYAVQAGVAGFRRGTLTAGTFTGSQALAGDAAVTTNNAISGVAYQGYQYLAAGSVAMRDNGTNAYLYPLPVPLPPFIQVGRASDPFTIASTNVGVWNGTWTASMGNRTSASGVGAATLSTFTTTASNTGLIVTAVPTGSHTFSWGTGGTNTQTNQFTNFDNPLPHIGNAGATFFSGTSTQTNTIGNYGVDYVQVGFSNPNSVVSISYDCSVGDAAFTNYWHVETTIGQIQDAGPDPLALLLAAQANQSSAILNELVNKTSFGSQVGARRPPGSVLQAVPNTVMTWAIPRSSYTLIGQMPTSATSGWTNIGAVRLVVQTTDQTQLVIGTPQTYGNSYNSITDLTNGVSWYATHQRVENGLIVAESAPSPGSTLDGVNSQPVICQYNAANVTLTGTFTSGLVPSSYGITHWGVYRQGGLLNDAYMVDQIPIQGANYLFGDGGYPDLSLLNNGTMTRSLWTSWPTAGVAALSEPYQGRVFVGTGNTLFWSTIGNPTQITANSDVTVSAQGDPIQALHVWNNLVIVNNNSVWELAGTVFDGTAQDWNLQRTGAKRGSAASKTCIKTPHGILLFGYDGLSLYYPGYGVDTPLTWVAEKIGDAWRGTGAGAPAAQKNRIPAITLSAIGASVAAYWDNKIYLAVPTGGSTLANSVFVLDVVRQRVWYYTYPFNITSLYYDYVGGRLVAGTDSGGTVLQVETGQGDTGSAVTWVARTRAWSTDRDMVLENVSAEAQAAPTLIQARAIIDNTNTSTLGTWTGTSKQWYITPMLGTVGNGVAFEFRGTQAGTSTTPQAVYQLGWDASVQPQRLQYMRTELDAGGNAGEKIWDVHTAVVELIGTGTVTGVTFVDNVAVLTQTYVAPSTVSQQPFPFPYSTRTGALDGSGPQTIPTAFPVETYGNVAYTTYTTGTFAGLTFKLYADTNTTRPEPPRVARYVTDRFSLAQGGRTVEGWWHSLLCELNPLGTATATVLVDGTAAGVYLVTGTQRASYAFALPTETYGNEAWVQYTSVGGVFKHYHTNYRVTEEPPRQLFWESENIAIPSESYIKTWLPEINPLGGTVFGTLLVDGTAISTQTMTGSVRKVFEFGVPNITVGKTLHARYAGFLSFKRWDRGPREFVFEQKPYNQTTWLVTYKKLGGVTQMDMARFYSLDVEGPLFATLTNTWILDGSVYTTDTFTLNQANVGEAGQTARLYDDAIPFPPGARGYLFQQQITASVPVRVWRSNIDIERIGVKGLSRVTLSGDVQAGQGGGG